MHCIEYEDGFCLFSSTQAGPTSGTACLALRQDSASKLYPHGYLYHVEFKYLELVCLLCLTAYVSFAPSYLSQLHFTRRLPVLREETCRQLCMPASWLDGFVDARSSY